jgi:hypothetical protein
MSVCTNTGSLPESGAEIIVNWMDGDSDTMTVFSSPNSQNCYIFEHSYSQAGVYNAEVSVSSGTSPQLIIGGETIEWVITNTSNCGFFNIITLLNPTATFLSNVPYDIVGNNGDVSTTYPINSFGNVAFKSTLTFMSTSDLLMTLSVCKLVVAIVCINRGELF